MTRHKIWKSLGCPVGVYQLWVQAQTLAWADAEATDAERISAGGFYAKGKDTRREWATWRLTQPGGQAAFTAFLLQQKEAA